MKRPIQAEVIDISSIKMSKEKLPVDIDLDYEIQLLYAMQGFKPVGISRHFQMSCIIDRLQENMEKTVNSKSIWDHLNKWYNLQQLNENEIIPFQNQEIDFNLPEAEFGLLKQKKSVIPVVKTTPLPSTPDKPNTPVTTQTKSSTSIPIVSKKTTELTPKDISTKIVSTSQKEEIKKESTTPMSSKSSSSSQRRDSFSQKSDQSKSSSNAGKKDFNQPGNTTGKKVIEKRGCQTKGRNTPGVSSSSKTKHLSNDMDKNREHSKNTERDDKDNPASVKRTTRGSLKPDESLTENLKSQSPLTISTPTSSGGSAPKRRRI